MGSEAGLGGALRLGGIAYLENGLFVDNISDDDGREAVSNIDFISGMSVILVEDKVCSCMMGTFLD